MRANSRRRILAFEVLESKATPSSLLLALAPLDESFHLTLEQSRDSAPLEMDTSGNWQRDFSTRDLLHFMHQHTTQRDSDSVAVAPPTVEQCQCADEMMKLGDGDVRVLIMADSIHDE